MVAVNRMEDLKGMYLREDIEVLTEPKFDDLTQKWIALANVSGSLCFISLKVEEIRDAS